MDEEKNCERCYEQSNVKTYDKNTDKEETLCEYCASFPVTGHESQETRTILSAIAAGLNVLERRMRRDKGEGAIG